MNVINGEVQYNEDRDQSLSIDDISNCSDHEQHEQYKTEDN